MSSSSLAWSKISRGWFGSRSIRSIGIVFWTDFGSTLVSAVFLAAGAFFATAFTGAFFAGAFLAAGAFFAGAVSVTSVTWAVSVVSVMMSGLSLCGVVFSGSTL